MKKISLILTLFLFSINSFSRPIDYTPSQASSNDNRAYVGIKWNLSGGIKPEAVVGFRYANINSNGDTEGGDLSISAKFIEGFQPGQILAKYFNGKQDVQGEVGGGYDFTQGILGLVGVHAPYSNIGVDLYPITQKFDPYIQVDTIKGNNKPNPTCPSPTYWNGSTCYYSPQPSDRRLKRSIRLLAKLHNGMKIYAFKYFWSDIFYVGVMAQDLLQNPAWKDAVVTKANGFYSVNYAMLGLQMTTLEQWDKDGLASIQLYEKITLN
jgi:hypothetical protein